MTWRIASFWSQIKLSKIVAIKVTLSFGKSTKIKFDHRFRTRKKAADRNERTGIDYHVNIPPPHTRDVAFQNIQAKRRNKKK